jgi:perosamine synthetase
MEKIHMFSPYVSEKAYPLIEKVLKNRWIGQGKDVSEFEEKFNSKFNILNSVAVNNVSSAIRLALDMNGVKPGDEVITTAQTCTASNLPILEQFAKPVFADVQYETGNIDPSDIEKRITKKTKAIIVCHWAGYPCDMDEIHEIGKRHDIVIIEDASDALGAKYKNKFIGNISKFTCFSFQAIKQITTGEGGMLCLTDKKDFDSALRKRWYGIDRINRKPTIEGYYDFDVFEKGYGYHMTNINAALGLANLEEFDNIQKRRKEIVSKYKCDLKGVKKLTLLKESNDVESANELFTIHVADRGKFCAHMGSEGIETSIVHMRNDSYSVFGSKRKDLPNLDKFTKTNISLPVHNGLSDKQVDHIIKTIKKGW